VQGKQLASDTARGKAASEQAVLKLLALACLGVLVSLAIGWFMRRQAARIAAMTRALIQRLRRSARRERAIRRTMLDGLITADRHGSILKANPAAEQLLGYQPGELVGQNLSVLMPRREAERHDAHIRHYLAGGEARIIGKGREVQAVRKDGSHIPVELGVVHLKQNGESLFVGFLHDISHRKENERLLKEAKASLAAEVMIRTAELETANRRLAREVAERKQVQELLARQATHDPLTGLPNRRLFHERLGQAVASARRHHEDLAVLYLDLDGFKQVNDRLGHEAGDELLQTIAARLLKQLRHEDVLARLGGDEFAVLLDHAGGRQQLTAIADKLLRTVAQPVVIGTGSARVGASIGIAQFSDEADAATLLRHADQAMYQAKRAGRGRYQLYEPTQSAQSVG
jgi:diguanylate cyclase (GGDEF)-like protein/PAS domain S-box-containing protein